MKKINVAELLKDCPKGMELDCYLFNGLEFDHIDTDNENYPIVCRAKDSTGEYYTHTFTKYGWYTSSYDYSKCVIFPKGKTSWEGFNRPFKDGDIVATNDSLFIGIVKYVDENCIYTYCAINKVGNLTQNCPYYFHRLATEEEKQKLFNAIKANGYKWNEETKTLGKLSKFKVGDRIILKDNPHNIPSIRIKEVTKSQYILETGSFFYIDSADEKYVLEDRFDITTLKPFDKVLTRDNGSQKWGAELFSFYNNEYEDYHFQLVGVVHARYCIPFVGNEHLLGTTNDCDEFYKTWE